MQLILTLVYIPENQKVKNEDTALQLNRYFIIVSIYLLQIELGTWSIAQSSYPSKHN